MRKQMKETEYTEEKQVISREQELAEERTALSHERTGLSILRTRLAFNNTELSVEQTHLSFLRTIVSLVGSAATIYTALPALGVPVEFSTAIAVFLLIAAIYFIIKDRMTYPKLKKEIREMRAEATRLAEKAGANGDDGNEEF